MPRLALLIDPGADPAALRRAADAWERLLDRAQRPTERCRTVLPGLAAVNLLTGFFPNRPQPAVSADGTLYLWLDGEVWDRAAARAATADPAGAPAENDAALCLELYLRDGDQFCERLNGQFVIAVWDTVRRRLLVCNDRYGFRPLFWGELDGALACGTEIKSVLAGLELRPMLDPGGTLELLAYGYQLADRTLFRGVHALTPGSRLVYEGGAVRVERYWRYRYPERVSRASEPELAEELARRMRIACARQAEGPGRVGMALSAGLDSRIVAAALPPTDPPRCAYTIGYPGSLDVLGARLLAETYGMRHLHMVPWEGHLAAVGPEVVWRTEGCFPFLHATSVQFHEQLRPELDILLTGHAGGALSGQSLLPLLPGDAARGDLEGYLFNRTLTLPPDRLRELLAPAAWNSEWEAARARFGGTVEELGDQRGRVGDAVIAWNMERRQARFINHSGQVDRVDFEVRAPLLDNDVVDFFLQVPYRYRFAQRLYKRTLADHFPEAARLPWSKTGGPVPGHPAAILAQFYGLGAWHQLQKKVPALARLSHDRTRSERVVADEMRRDIGFRSGILEPFLAGDAFPDSVLSRAAAQQAVTEHWAGTRNRWHEVACLATLALVSRHFLERGLEAPTAARLREAA